MPRLETLQRDLAQSLTAGGDAPSQVDEAAVRRAAAALVAKRRRAVAHLLPELRRALGEDWVAEFAVHADIYQPAGLLHHVDDAMAFADLLSRAGESEIRPVARKALRRLRVQYVRRVRETVYRVRPRGRIGRMIFAWWLGR